MSPTRPGCCAPALALLLALAGSGCDPLSPCDPGQTLVRSVCVDPAPTDAAAAVDAAGDGPGDGGAADAADDAGGCGDRYAGFGHACKSAADCPCGLDYCLDYASYNFCTHTGCTKDPGICPGGWICVDTGLYTPGGPAICFKQ